MFQRWLGSSKKTAPAAPRMPEVSEPSWEELSLVFGTLAAQQQSVLAGLLGTAIGDAVGLPFELKAHAKNRRDLDLQQSHADPAATFWDDVLPFLMTRLKRSEGTPFGRTFSDDTVCTDLKMQVVAKISLSGGEEDAIFEAMLQEYLAWANNAEGNLFQGYGGFTRELLRPSRLGCLWKPGSDFLPTEEYKRFAKEHFEGVHSAPSWGNGAVMSITPQVLMQLNGSTAAKELSRTHLEASAVLASDFLAEILGAIHQKKLKSSKDMGQLLTLPSWKRLVDLNTQDSYVYPIAAFQEFLANGDCQAETANSFLLNLITRSGLAPSEADLAQGTGPFGHFGELLRIASNYDDEPAHHGLRLTVAEQPEVMVRFSQRGLNTVLIATWCATAAESCVDWLRRVLYVGGDADTVGAVAGQIACPLLSLEEVLAVYQRAVAVAMPVNCAAARRYAYRSGLFVAGNWPQLLSCPRLVDPVYDSLTTEDGMRLKGHRRTACRFGGKCYDQKKGHRAQYSHPGDVDWQRLPCRYAARGCRDRSQGHALEFAHPGDLDWDATARVQL